MDSTLALWNKASEEEVPGTPISNAPKPDVKAYAKDLKQLHEFCENIEAIGGECGLWKEENDSNVYRSTDPTKDSKSSTHLKKKQAA
jgi:hypothetical protein